MAMLEKWGVAACQASTSHSGNIIFSQFSISLFIRLAIQYSRQWSNFSVACFHDISHAFAYRNINTNVRIDVDGIHY